MIRFPKPRGFWDYAIFVLFMTGLLLLVFWTSSAYRIVWTDAAFAFVVATLVTLCIVAARRNEKAKWIKRATWRTAFIVCITLSVLFYAADYAHGYLLHHTTITAYQLRHDLISSLLLSAWMSWWWHRRSRASSRLSEGTPAREA